MKALNRLFLIAFAIPAIGNAAEALPLEDFAKLPEYYNLRISPTGEYLAVIAPVEDQDGLVVFDLAAMEVASVLRLSNQQDVLEFRWVNEDRLVYTSGRRRPGRGEVLYTTGELFAMNADGGHQELIFGYRAGRSDQADTRIRGAKPIRAAGEVVDVLRNDRDEILVASYPIGMRKLRDTTPTIYSVNVYSGARKKRPPVPYGTMSYLADDTGNIRVAWGYDDNYRFATFYRDAKSFDIGRVASLSDSAVDYFPLAFDETNDRVFLAASPGDNAYGLVRYDPAGDSVESMWESDSFDIHDIVMNAEQTDVIAASYYADRLKYTYFDASHPKARLLASIQKAFPDHDIDIESTTWDGRKSILRVGNSSTPDEFYVFDFETRQMARVLGSRSWIDPTLMSPAEHFEFEARDGLVIRGYLTRPLGHAEGTLPLIVLPHGGPHGVRDLDRFDPNVQLFANRGYAVLQVNFRGSGGYGAAFERAGYRHWGTSMQDDITDAVHWAIDGGVADVGRICIVGASFGGYSALMGAVREPDLYRCAIGQFGVYDLPLMFTTGDIQETNIGTGFIELYLGADEAELVRQSPARNVSGIKADLMIVYGERDDRAPPAQSKALMDALDEAEIEYELVVYEDEAHGARNVATRTEHYRRMLDFLDARIGSAP